MTLERSIRWFLMIASIMVVAPAHAQTPGPDSVVYVMAPESDFQFGCYGPCACPVVVRQPLRGTFTLIRTGSDPLYDYYDVADVRWEAPGSTTPFPVRGSGTYRRGGEVAIQEQLTLDLSINGGNPERYDSGLVPPEAPFPAIRTRIYLHGGICLDSAFTVVAKPGGVAAVQDDRLSGLMTAVPSPFLASTDVGFSLSRGGRVDVVVFDLTGREVRSLVRGEWLGAGRHQRSWDGRLENGGAAAPGLYFVGLRTHDGLRTREVVKLR